MLRFPSLRDLDRGLPGRVWLCAAPVDTRADDPKIQRIKVSCCFTCNQFYSKDEAHFRAIVTMAGEVVTPERRERWKLVERSFLNPTSGPKDLIAVLEKMVPVTGQDRSQNMVYPAKDERVVRIVKKITCGLGIHNQVFQTFVSAGKMSVDILAYPLPPDFENGFEHVIPNAMSYLYYKTPETIDHVQNPEFNEFMADKHSFWVIHLLSIRFLVIVQR